MSDATTVPAPVLPDVVPSAAKPALHTSPTPDPELQAVVERHRAASAMAADGESKMLTKGERSVTGWVYLSFCLAYVGFPFHGLQIQPKMRMCDTVEGIFLRACDAAGLIVGGLTEGKPLKHHMFARSCRTDAGVHAVRNQLTMAVEMATWKALGGPDGVLEAVNTHLQRLAPAPWVDALPEGAPDPTTAEGGSGAVRPEGAPPAIEVITVSRVSIDYVPRFMTTRRVYRFMVPLFALDRRLDAFATDVDLSAPEGGLWKAGPVPLRSGLAAPTVDELNADAYAALGCNDEAKLRIRAAIDDLIPRLRSPLLEFVGRHRFHNFTGVEAPSANARAITAQPLIKSTDNEAVRFINRAAVVSDPVFVPVFEEGGTSFGLPFAMIQLEGNSFLLHMIRKLVGTCVAVARGASPELVAKALDGGMLVNTPMVPGSGLLLHQPFFDIYDIRDTPAYPKLCLEWARARHRAMKFEEGTLRQAIALREAFDSGVLPREGRVPTAHPQANPAREVTTLPSGSERASMMNTLVRPKVMTVFLRLLRMHNWNIRKSAHVASNSNRRDRKAARKAEARAALEAAAADEAGPETKAHRAEGDVPVASAAAAAADSAPADFVSERPRGTRARLGDAIDSGWICGALDAVAQGQEEPEGDRAADA